MTMPGMRDGHSDGAGSLDLAEIVERISPHPQNDLQGLFSMMVFDIAISDQDDHLWDHGFLLVDSARQLSPHSISILSIMQTIFH